MCDAYTPAGEPISTNKRYNAAKVFSHPDVVAEEPWYVLAFGVSSISLTSSILSLFINLFCCIFIHEYAYSFSQV